MKGELNDYKITNKDGIIKSNNDGKIKYNNEDSHYFKENSLSNQNENFTEKETFDLDQKDETKKQNTLNDINNLTNSVSTATSSVTSSASTIGSSLGSVIGGVVSSIATATIVVAAFVSMLTINIALVLAGTNSLVFKLEMIGAQKEDFENKTYYAVLEGDGYKQSQEIFMDSVYITFDDLEPGKEYTITIRNDEKVFVEKSYFTTTEDDQRSFIEAWSEEKTVYALINVGELKSNEFYTFTATDSKGKVLFSDSDVKQEKKYSFNVESSDTISLTLAINGKVCCFEQCVVEFEPTSGDDPETGDTHTHNYIPSGFVWEYDDQGNLIAFGEGICAECEDVLRIPAEMSRDGDFVIASIIYNGTQYTDKRVEIDVTGKEDMISDDNCYWIKPNSFVLGNPDSDDTISYRNNRYIIKGTAEGISNFINIYNSGLSIPDVGYRSDYYFEFNNLNIIADGNSSSTIFSVQTKYDVTIHIAVRGKVSLTTNGSYCFNVENYSDDDITVTFDVTFIDEDSSFDCFDELFETTSLYNPESDTNIVFNINGVQVDSNGEEISASPSEGVELSLSNGPIYIRPNDYVQHYCEGEYIQNSNSETNPYIISGSIYSGESIDVYNFTETLMSRTGRGNGQKETFYLVLDNVTLSASQWCTAFRIIASQDVDIYITAIGNIRIQANNHAAFSLQGESGCHANIYVTCEGGFENFVCFDDYNEENSVYEADEGMSVSFYMNGVQVDANGEQI